jgi:hypothetical protein
MNQSTTKTDQVHEAEGRCAPASCSAARGLVCCFCGKAWGYVGESPTAALLKEAVDHEAKCPRNPYLAEIKRLRTAIEETLADNAHLADGNTCTLIKLKRAVSPNNRI